MSKAAKLVFALVVITSMVLAACGPTPTATPAPTATTAPKPTTAPAPAATTAPAPAATAAPAAPTATSAPVATATPAAKAVDTIIVSLQQEPDTLHPDVGSMMARTIVNGPVFPGMAASNDKAEWVAMGLTQLPTVENGGAKLVGTGADQYLEVTCKIKAGLKWHDGTPVTGADAVYRWKLFMDEKFEAADRTFAEKFFNITSPTPDTFVIKYLTENQVKQAVAGTLKGDVNFSAYKEDYEANFGEWTGPVVDPLYFTCYDVLPNHILSKVAPADQEKSDFAKAPVGYGPYKFKAWKPAQQVELEAVTDNVLGVPKIKNIIFKIIPDGNAIIAGLQKGEIDVASQIGIEVSMAPELDKLEKDGKYKISYIPGYQWEHIDLNTSKFPFDDVKVRKAVAYGIDKKSYLNTLYYGKQPSGDSWVPAFNWAYGGDQIVRYDFDKAKATALLKEAGWDTTKNPVTKSVTDAATGKAATKNLEFTLVTTDRKDRQQKAQIVQAQLRTLNLGVNLSFLYGRGLFATCTAGGPLGCRTFDAAIYTWLSGEDPDPSSLYFCKSIPTKENNYSGQNYPGFCNKDFDTAGIKAAFDVNTALSREKRKPLYVQMQKVWSDAVPVIPLESNVAVFAARPGMKNFKPTPTQSPETWNAWEWELTK